MSLVEMVGISCCRSGYDKTLCGVAPNISRHVELARKQIVFENAFVLSAIGISLKCILRNTS